MSSVIKWGVLAILIFIGLWGIWIWNQTRILEQAFAQVRREDSPAQIIRLFGRTPLETTNIKTTIWWDGVWLDKTNGVKCVRQFHFFPPFTICGESWEIGFDESNKTVHKYHFFSP